MEHFGIGSFRRLLSPARPQDDRTAAAWQVALGISSPPASGTMVFLRGPGSAPRTLAVPPGSAARAADLQQLIDSNGASLRYPVATVF